VPGPSRKSEFPGRIHAAASRKSVIGHHWGAMPFFWRTMPALPRWHTTAVPQIAADLLQRQSGQRPATCGLLRYKQTSPVAVARGSSEARKSRSAA